MHATRVCPCVPKIVSYRFLTVSFLVGQGLLESLSDFRRMCFWGCIFCCCCFFVGFFFFFQKLRSGKERRIRLMKYPSSMGKAAEWVHYFIWACSRDRRRKKEAKSETHWLQPAVGWISCQGEVEEKKINQEEADWGSSHWSTDKLWEFGKAI